MDYSQLASEEMIRKTAAALAERRVEVLVVDTKEEALAKIKELVPAGASVMNGASRTLEEVGYIEYLKSGAHPWNNLHAMVLAEKDPAKQKALRIQALASDYYLGSVHALAATGEIVVASNSGSQLPHIVFTSPNVLFVVGTQKIVPSLDLALARLKEYVVPLEDARMQQAYGVGTHLAKLLVFNGENPASTRKFRAIIVREKLGF